jgi:hypothetical protein
MTEAPTTETFRCSAASLDDDEPLAGSAPTDRELLLVEDAGPWGRAAVAESRLPDEVRAWLAGLEDVRVQLVRRPGGRSGPGVRVLRAVAGPDGFDVRATTLERITDLPSLDPASMEPRPAPLWLVCTNGRRDRCCAEQGRPVAAALAERWPEGTWETTHLGGHRYAATLLALPSGHTLGRLDPASAVAACADLAAGLVPLGHSRGRAGLAPEEQVRELHVLAGGDPDVDVVGVPGPQRRQSCADALTKPTVRWQVRPR